MLRVEDIDLAADRELVERWQAGEHEAFDDLYKRYFTRLRSYCQRRVGDRDAAEEIAQEAFVKALVALPRFGGERRFYPWVTVIASRLCVDHHRRLGRVRPVEEIDPGTVDGDHGTRLSFLADVDNLDRALQRLGPRHLEVLELRERRGMTYAEIADHLHVPQSTVEALLFRARKALRREFMAVSGEGKLASIPAVAFLLRRLATVRDRLGELGPAIAQLTAPMAAGAMAVALSFGPLAPSESNGPAATRVAPQFRTTSTSEVLEPPAPVLETADPIIDAPPATRRRVIHPMGHDEAASAAADMPVHASAGPVTLGVAPDAIVEEWVPTILELLEDDE